MDTYSYSRSVRVALIGVATIAASYAVCLATVGTVLALLSVPSAMPAVQSLPGANADSIVAIAKRIDPAVFETERRLHAVQLNLPALKVKRQAKHAKMERLAGGLL